MPLQWFFEKYESDLDVAWRVDKVCLTCPVIKECYRYGVLTKAEGQWGGVYLMNGEIDPRRNAHKSREQWDQIEEKLEVQI